MSMRWRELCERYLPITPQNSLWRYSRAPNGLDPEQGWKLHISATVLTANSVLERVGPLLIECDVQFKAPSSLRELSRLNSGLHYGYCQVGKFITIYPRTIEEFSSLAQTLHQLTRHMSAPAVPFDLRFRPGSNVYYRYGAFKNMEIKHADGTLTLALQSPDGRLVPDVRESFTGKPDWVSEPLLDPLPSGDDWATETPLKTTFRAFRAITQRGKGGVYKAVDRSVRPERFCLLKEGRQSGEMSWDGRDGSWRIRHEEHVISLLCAAGIPAPQVYSSFTAESNYYLVTEFIEGQSLHSLLLKRKNRLPMAQALWYAVQLAELVSRIHAAGWVWRDCKPANIIVAKNGILRPLDFEGACPVDQPDPQPWGTPAFTPPEWSEKFHGQSRVPEDLYAIGAVIYLVVAGRLPESSGPLPIEKLRRKVPPEVRRIIFELLSPSPHQRPNAQHVTKELKTISARLGNSCEETDSR